MAAKKQSLKKRILNSPAGFFVLSFLVSLLMRLLFASNRISKHFPSESAPYFNGEKPAVFCFWHGRLLMQSFIKPKGRSMTVLMSSHTDGAFSKATMRWFGIDGIRASKKSGTTRAMLGLLKLTEAGGNICITPDGPRGPNEQAAIGPGFFAAKTGLPVIAVTFSSTRHWRLRSWDRFMIPKPFGRIVFVGHTPITVADAEDTTLAAAQAELQRGLDLTTAEADRLCGVTA